MPKKRNKTQKRKFTPEECTDQMTFQDCELAILRHAVDDNEKVLGNKLATSDAIRGMIKIVEEFLMRKKLICYGGTAINNILPKFAQFYDRDYEVPDYDFFSANAMDDAKELADLFYKEGYLDVEAKSGVHEGTYKVFVNFIPMADITYIHKDLFDALSKEAISVAGIKYAPPNFLRMSMYLELSRPAGDTSRWEKVLKRMTLLNEYRPMKVDYDCEAVDFQRKMEDDTEESEKLYLVVRDTFIEMGVVFFGGYASSLYSRYMPKKTKKIIEKIPDFDVLSEDPQRTATIVEERLADAGFKNIKIIHHDAIGEIVPEHIEIRYDKELLAFIYKPIACHNYNTIQIGHQEINVATIDTIMSFYLAFLYAGADYYYKDRILCMAKYLFEVEQKSRLSQRGLLKRFVPKCIGVQETMESIRAKKSTKFDELRGKRGTREYDEVFLKYIPGDKDKKDKKSSDDKIDTSEKEVSKKKKTKTRKTSKKKDKSKTSNLGRLFGVLK
jgi:hypothetical protein